MLRASTHVDASPERLWTLLSDLPRWPELLPTISSVQHLGGPQPPGVGSRYRVRQPGLPAATYEITQWEPGEGFTWEARSPGVTSSATHRLAAEGGGALLDLTFAWSGPLAPLVRWLGGRKGQRYVEAEAATFARLATR